jgi:large conductance mechanosensitive channel
VTSLVTNVFTPVISLLNIPDFSTAVVEAGDAGAPGDIRYGLVINALISFLVIAAIVFFFVVKPMNHLTARGDKEDEPARQECPHCLSSIAKEATVCAHCTRDIVSADSKTRPASATRSGRRRSTS